MHLQTKNWLPLTIITIAVLSCNNKSTLKQTSYNWPANIAPPVCEIKPKELIAHGDTRTDNYYWLNDFFKKGPDSTKVVDY
ncbi:MAG: Oligopeptidase, partial [Ferruginibacter sp.]|nr:Oligopeptidase [Ferruginibacter sp.]